MSIGIPTTKELIEAYDINSLANMYRHERRLREMLDVKLQVLEGRVQVKAILDDHKKWLDTDGEAGERADLRYTDLSYTDLSYTDLRNANLAYANLSYTDLSYTDLSYTELSHANLAYADLSYTELSHANLAYADLSYTELTGAKLIGAKLIDAPAVFDLHQKVYAAASKPGALEMDTWHTCATTHCQAGWVVMLAGDEGRELEEEIGTPAAAALIYMASDPDLERIPDFYAENYDALADMKRLSDQEKTREALKANAESVGGRL